MRERPREGLRSWGVRERERSIGVRREGHGRSCMGCAGWWGEGVVLGGGGVGGRVIGDGRKAGCRWAEVLVVDGSGREARESAG